MKYDDKIVVIGCVTLLACLFYDLRVVVIRYDRCVGHNENGCNGTFWDRRW